MAEFVTISAPSSDAASLAARLTQKSAEGWDVVAIVPTGSELTAFLQRTSALGVAAVAASGATEPAGWGTAPASATASTTVAQPSSPAASTTATMSAATSTTSSTGATPAGWYHDPSGRFELRYWDGSAWTEHVARGGQQYTDPPVA